MDKLSRSVKLSLVAALLALTPGFDTSVLAQGQVRPEQTRPERNKLEFVPGQILVQFQPGTTGQEVAETHRRLGGQAVEVLSEIDVQVVRVPRGQETARATAYARNPNVNFAEVDGLYYAVGEPSDSRVDEQWQYDNRGQSGGTVGADISAYAAWDTSAGTTSVRVAVLDSGIDRSHEDLATKVVATRNFSSSRTTDDQLGHGTHVAGSAGALTNNALGVAGTCPGCALYNAKVLGDTGSGSWSGIAKGINWATDNGAQVISMSLGGYSASSTVESAVNRAWKRGVVLAAAALNDGQDWGAYPAAFSNVIAVAATNHSDRRASFSNHGAWVDVAAPGESILSTAPDHRSGYWSSGVKYGTLSGTSMATPHVAGLAGLVWSSSLCGGPSSKRNSCVRERIENSADRVDGSTDLQTGSQLYAGSRYGRVNACRAVEGSGC